MIGGTIGWLVIATIFAYVSWKLALDRDTFDPRLWGLIGFFFGPFGLLVLLTNKKPAQTTPTTPDNAV